LGLNVGSGELGVIDPQTGWFVAVTFRPTF